MAKKSEVSSIEAIPTVQEPIGEIGRIVSRLNYPVRVSLGKLAYTLQPFGIIKNVNSMDAKNLRPGLVFIKK